MKHKLTINRLAWNTIKHRRKQYTVLIISIVLAMLFSSGVPFFFSCINASLEQIQIRRFGMQDLLLLNAQNQPMEEMQQNESVVGKIGYIHEISYIWNGEEDRGTELAWMDERAQELYFPQLKQGRMPEKSGEIAVEENALLRMRVKPELGAEVSFHVRPRDGANHVSETTEKSYILVGVLENRRPLYEKYFYEFGSQFPAAFTVPGEQTEIGGKEAQIALFELDTMKSAAVGGLYSEMNDLAIDTRYISDYGTAGTELMRNGRMLAFLALLLAFLTCFFIVNAFGTLLKERTAQIGMMRAVGAARRQIFWIFGRETLLLALVCAPVSLGISLGGIWLYARCMGEDFVFAPNFAVIGLGLLFSLLCVMAAAMIPLVCVSRLSPMQAIRDVHISKKVRRSKIRSRKTFKMPQLLAKRKSTFSQGRSILIRLILTVTTFICCISVVVSASGIKSMALSAEKSDYKIYPTRGHVPENSFIYSEDESFITEAQRLDACGIPFVEEVYGTKKVRVNLLLNEVPKYLQLFEIGGVDFQMGRYENTLPLNEPSMTEDKLLDFAQAQERSVYTDTKARAGYEQEALNFNMRSADNTHFEELFPYQVVEGKIDLEALDSGTEVVLNAPQTIGFVYHVYPDGSCVLGAMNTDPEAVKKMDPFQKENLDYIVSSAQNPFHAGDKLTISMLFEETDGSLRRVDRTVRIGAIVQHPYSFGAAFELFTTHKALELFGQDFAYDNLYIDCDEDLSGEADMEIQRALAGAFPSKGIISTYETNRSGKNTIRQMTVSFGSLIAVLFVVCTSLINNGITAQIREDRRSIGTLRAVGASQRDIMQCYRLQIVRTLLWGVGLGMICVLAGQAVLSDFFYLAGTPCWVGILPAFVLLAALLCVCLLNLHIQVKKVSRQSIVDNIREL